MDNNEFDFCKPYLAGDEYVMWSGKPEKGNLLTASDIFMIPFSILWCGFAFFWTFSALASGAGLFGLFGLPFIAVGLFIVFGRFIMKAQMRKKTCYVVTNKRILCKAGRSISMIELKNIPPVNMTMHKNGNGTITIGQPNYYARCNNTSYFQTPLANGITLENIADAVKVQQLICSAE